MHREQKTSLPSVETRQKQWFLLDASGKTLGRLTSEIAKILRGKHKPTYVPHLDCGDGVIVVNADKIVVTGNKAAQKLYRYYTGSMSGLRSIGYREMLARRSSYIIRHAVEGMLPKTRLGDKQSKYLRVFAKGEPHDLDSLQPIPVNI